MTLQIAVRWSLIGRQTGRGGAACGCFMFVVAADGRPTSTALRTDSATVHRAGRLWTAASKPDNIIFEFALTDGSLVVGWTICVHHLVVSQSRSTSMKPFCVCALARLCDRTRVRLDGRHSVLVRRRLSEIEPSNFLRLTDQSISSAAATATTSSSFVR